jgi:hypothetical protein
MPIAAGASMSGGDQRGAIVGHRGDRAKRVREPADAGGGIRGVPSRSAGPLQVGVLLTSNSTMMTITTMAVLQGAEGDREAPTARSLARSDPCADATCGIVRFFRSLGYQGAS